MWVVLYNQNTIWSLFLGAAFGFGMYSFSRNPSLAMAFGGAGVVAHDLYCRLRCEEASPTLLHPDSGGHIMFIPVWILGLALLGFAGLEWLGWV